MQWALYLLRLGLLRLGLALLALAGCGTSAVLNVQHEEQGKLAGRSTYAFGDAPALKEQGFTSGHLFNQIMQRRIRDEVSKELALRGYTPSPPDQAALLVTFSAGGRQDVVSQGDQKGPVVHGPAYTIDRGALVLHFLDPASKEVIWRGWGDGVLDPDADLDSTVRTAVHQIMAAFPASQS